MASETDGGNGELLFDTFDLADIIHRVFAAGIRYDCDEGVGKVGNLDTDRLSAIPSLDCSGFVQFVLYRSTFSNLKLIGGSVNQRDYCKRNFRTAVYAREGPLLDEYVRIGFRKTIPAVEAVEAAAGRPAVAEVKKKVGHVWLVINGRTYESTSKGGRGIGPKSFLWSVRKHACDYFYRLGPAPGFRRAMSDLAPVSALRSRIAGGTE